jgi:hypothetical protein
MDVKLLHTPCVEGFSGYYKYCCFDRILKTADCYNVSFKVDQNVDLGPK